MTIGVVAHGVRKILSYGAVKPDSRIANPLGQGVITIQAVSSG